MAAVLAPCGVGAEAVLPIWTWDSESQVQLGSKSNAEKNENGAVQFDLKTNMDGWEFLPPIPVFATLIFSTPR